MSRTLAHLRGHRPSVRNAGPAPETPARRRNAEAMFPALAYLRGYCGGAGAFFASRIRATRSLAMSFGIGIVR